MNLGDHRMRLHVQGDSYKQMVVALRAFTNEMLFDDDAREVVAHGTVRCGRRMKTSPTNKRAPSAEVTPDLVIQPSPTYGIIAECKWGVPRDEGLFAKTTQETVEQLEKYDDDLARWPASADGLIATHDLVLLVNHEDSKRVAMDLALRRQQNTFRTDRNFSVVGVGQFKRADGLWTVLDLEDGRLADDKKTSKLHGRLHIDPAKLALNRHVALIELCDTAPPTPVMMELVHKAVIQQLSREQHEQHRLDGSVKQTVTLHELLEWVGRFAFPQLDKHDAICPREKWLREAMTTFVAMKWAEKPDARNDEWVFLHKRGRRTPYARFIHLCAKRDHHNALRAERAKEREAERAKKKKLAVAAKARVRQEREEQKKAKQLQKAIDAAPLFADVFKRVASRPKRRTKSKKTGSPLLP